MNESSRSTRSRRRCWAASCGNAAPSPLAAVKVRQIELNAITRLRSPRFAGRLRDYWELGQ